VPVHVIHCFYLPFENENDKTKVVVFLLLSFFCFKQYAVRNVKIKPYAVRRHKIKNHALRNREVGSPSIMQKHSSYMLLHASVRACVHACQNDKLLG